MDALAAHFGGTPTVDRFATAANRVCPRFNSYFTEPGCEGTDAFAQHNWNDELNFVNPPLSQIGRVVCFLREQFPHARVLFLAPSWRA